MLCQNQTSDISQIQMPCTYFRLKNKTLVILANDLLLRAHDPCDVALIYLPGYLYNQHKIHFYTLENKYST